VYYRDRAWHIFDGDDGATRNLTAGLETPFANEDHDYPRPAPGYGVADWIEGDRAVLIYDKYDLWLFPTGGGEPLSLTEGRGRRESTTYRVVDLDDDRDYLRVDERLLLSAYHHERKTSGFCEARAGQPGVRPLVGGQYKLSFVAKARKAERLVYTRESYNEFPDLRVAERSLDSSRRLSDANPTIADFAWGEAELVEWRSADGIPLQGVLIKPGGYEPGKRYPVLVYFYRFFSQRLHEFNEPVVNHRPSFPVYASHGYAVFLPDIRFEVGRPGFSATKCLVPGIQRLVDMGVADPDAIGLHGHSLSGYQAAFVVTQTDIFAAAVAGAPVSNMTSAYGGIRWRTGMARQFQYERTQSRLGGTLWDSRDRYIDNSPLFFADRVNTPLLIQHGDDDGAVPWYQSIELYLALRRLGKECIFLQYRGEPHHLQKYPNKLDYSIKMKQFFDHHLKNEPAPAWMTKGVPYRGE
ncbi:MAG: S9 family peptidase, partial [Deltaproteobacteria bacterium]|nr:S9 family peptidase [Deltaproteobacteria bacterium]